MGEGLEVSGFELRPNQPIGGWAVVIWMFVYIFVYISAVCLHFANSKFPAKNHTNHTKLKFWKSDHIWLSCSLLMIWTNQRAPFGCCTLLVAPDWRVHSFLFCQTFHPWNFVSNTPHLHPYAVPVGGGWLAFEGLYLWNRLTYRVGWGHFGFGMTLATCSWCLWDVWPCLHAHYVRGRAPTVTRKSCCSDTDVSLASLAQRQCLRWG